MRLTDEEAKEKAVLRGRPLVGEYNKVTVATEFRCKCKAVFKARPQQIFYGVNAAVCGECKKKRDDKAKTNREHERKRRKGKLTKQVEESPVDMFRAYKKKGAAIADIPKADLYTIHLFYSEEDQKTIQMLLVGEDFDFDSQQKEDYREMQRAKDSKRKGHSGNSES